MKAVSVHGFLAQPPKAGAPEQLERCEERCGGQHRRIAHLPALGAGDGMEVRAHFEAARLVVSPPAREAR